MPRLTMSPAKKAGSASAQFSVMESPMNTTRTIFAQVWPVLLGAPLILRVELDHFRIAQQPAEILASQRARFEKECRQLIAQSRRRRNGCGTGLVDDAHQRLRSLYHRCARHQ
jgi:hypothetical protein